MGLKLMHEISEDYEFEFSISESDDEVFLQDKNGFNFLSIKLNDGDKQILSKEAAVEILNFSKGDIESRFKDYQSAYIKQKEDLDFQSMVHKTIKFYNSEIDSLKSRRDGCTELEAELIEIQIANFERMIKDLEKYIVEY